MDNLHGDFGQSIHYKRPVADILLERLPWSLWIMGSTLALSLLLGVALALLCVRPGPTGRSTRPSPPWRRCPLPHRRAPALPGGGPGGVDSLSGAYTHFAQYDGLWQRLGTSWCTA
ncbi:hypothetical protein M5E87_14940 [Flavonifractor plautii]|nr:hypothetical protein M5E87_14940 [Flavonifractor plautii]